MSDYVSQEQFRQMEGALQATRDLVADVAQNLRSPSKAALIGTGPRSYADTSGTFIKALADARSADATSQAAGKAMLESLGVSWAEPPESKATLGTSVALGGAVLPNDVVDQIVPILVASNPYRNLLTVIENVAAAGVDIPTEDSAVTRALVVAWGALKPSEDLSTSRYTATLYTLSRIMDVSNQLLRHSAGAAQAEVIARLGRSMGLGEAYYILNGSGTAEPYGLLTALAAIGGHDTNKGAATTTVATSIAGTIVSGVSALAERSVVADAVVLDPVSYWKAFIEATSTFSVMGSLNGAAVSPVSIGGDGVARLFTLPMLADPNMPANTGLVGQFKSAKLYTGMGYRLDVSDQAGTRWDYNLTGFRAEEEVAFNGLPYVLAGRFQRLTNLNT